MNQISPLAYVHPEAKLGDNNVIGPFCYIDRNTVIGDNNVFQNSVTINYGARIGNNNEILAGASISTKPQDLKFKGEDTICEIGDNNSIRENVTISRGTASKGTTKVGNNNLLMENMHIAHDCVVGNGCIIGNSTKIKDLEIQERRCFKVNYKGTNFEVFAYVFGSDEDAETFSRRFREEKNSLFFHYNTYYITCYENKGLLYTGGMLSAIRANDFKQYLFDNLSIQIDPFAIDSYDQNSD